MKIHMITEVISQTIMITSFVMVMMLLIEYINVRSRGLWTSKLKKSETGQVFLGATLGLLPGCLGSYAMVSLYTHNMLTLGALTATMIATTGDEAFIMFSMIPGTALKIMAIIFVFAVVTGYLMNLFMKKKKYYNKEKAHFPIHEEKSCNTVSKSEFKHQWKELSFERAILIAGILVYLFLLISGKLEHSHLHQDDFHAHGEWSWIRITFLIASSIVLFIVAIVPDHFLKEHLWEHIIKKHFLKIFLWTFGALLVIEFLLEHYQFESWLDNNHIIILITALLIGIIPISGPHLVFVTLFFNQAIPFSILLANSIVQDGHGSLPLFAESKKSFIQVKAINLLVGLIVGLAGYFLNW